MHNPGLVYSSLALYTLLTIAVIAYVHAKFRTAARALKLLQTEWEGAQSNHTAFVGAAQERLSKLSSPSAPAIAPAPRTGAVGLDMRNQIVSMAKRGMRVNNIARACGLQEGEVEVILGMARLER